MSIAAGRAWTALGQNLGNIGNLLLQQQELERERQRQAEQDAIAARNQTMREAAFTQETGLTPFGTPAQRQGVYSGGEYVPSLPGKQLMAAPEVAKTPESPTLGFGSGPGVTLPDFNAPVAKPSLTAIGNTVLANTVPPVAGGQNTIARSADQRATDVKLKRASMDASALSADGPNGAPLNPAFAALPWREQVNTVQSPTAMSALDQRQRQMETLESRRLTAQAKEQEDRAAFDAMHELSPSEYQEYVPGRNYSAEHLAFINNRYATNRMYVSNSLPPSPHDASAETDRAYQQALADAQTRYRDYQSQLNGPNGIRMRIAIRDGRETRKDLNNFFADVVRERSARGVITPQVRDQWLTTGAVGGDAASAPSGTPAPTTRARGTSAPAAAPSRPGATETRTQQQIDWDNLPGSAADKTRLVGPRP